MSRKMPALLTTPSSRPKWSVAVLTILLAGIASATELEVWDSYAARFLISSTTSSAGEADEPAPSAEPAGIVDHDLGASAAAEQRGSHADTAARAGDDDDFVLK